MAIGQHSEYFETYTTFNETIRCASKVVNKRKSRVSESQVCNLPTTHSSVLYYYKHDQLLFTRGQQCVLDKNVLF